MNRSRRVTGLAILLMTATFLLASCGGDKKKSPMTPGGGTADLVIHIQLGSFNAGSNAYAPNPATVTVGQKVQWVNDDNMTHTATADGGSFDTGGVGAGGSSGLVTMSTQGSFPYHCAIPGHNLTGTITVNP